MVDRETAHLVTRVLRHRPELAGIRLDEHGWADVNELLQGMNRIKPITRTGLEEIVATDNKNRFSFSQNKTRIRANQGHSVDVDVEPERLPLLLVCDRPRHIVHASAGYRVGSVDTALDFLQSVMDKA